MKTEINIKIDWTITFTQFVGVLVLGMGLFAMIWLKETSIAEISIMTGGGLVGVSKIFRKDSKGNEVGIG